MLTKADDILQRGEVRATAVVVGGIQCLRQLITQQVTSPLVFGKVQKVPGTKNRLARA